MFAEAYSEGYVKEDIMKHVPSLKNKRKKKEPFKPTEADAILNEFTVPFSSC